MTDWKHISTLNRCAILDHHRNKAHIFWPQTSPGGPVAVLMRTSFTVLESIWQLYPSEYENYYKFLIQ